jgi:hypothetical protein
MESRYSIHVLNAIGQHSETVVGYVWAGSISEAYHKAGRIMVIGYRIAIGFHA